MPLKFLIDECLSPELVTLARNAGHYESTCVRDRGWAGSKDYELMERVIAEDFTLVTHNARDFRGDGPDVRGGLYARRELHAGLVCLSAEEMDLEVQMELFQAALDELEGAQDLTNQCIEIILGEDSIEVVKYEIPV